MGNSWKAKCVKHHDKEYIGYVIEVEDGKAIVCSISPYTRHFGEHLESFDTWRDYQKDSEWVLITDEETGKLTDDEIELSEYRKTLLTPEEIKLLVLGVAKNSDLTVVRNMLIEKIWNKCYEDK